MAPGADPIRIIEKSAQRLDNERRTTMSAALSGYPWLIHRLAYRRTNHDNMHVRGYKKKGNINTPLELAINNQIDRFDLAIDVIDCVLLRVAGAHAKEKFRDQQIECRNYAHEHGMDKPEMANWRWPHRVR